MKIRSEIGDEFEKSIFYDGVMFFDLFSLSR